MMRLIVFLIIGFSFSGCATMKSWFGFGETSKQTQNSFAGSGKVNSNGEVEGDDYSASDDIRYSDNNQVLPLSDRQYKKMTRSRMEEESELGAQAGSLWMMEGQTSFLFAQNKSRREGDATNIKLEGSAMKLVENKAKSAQKLLKKLEDHLKAQEEAERIASLPVEASRKPASEMDDSKKAAENVASKPVEAPKVEKEKEELPKLDLADVERIPVRITDRTEQGFRVRGSQPLMINEKEYRVITTGIIKAEDFSDDVVSSNKMLDAQFDLVSAQGDSEGRKRQ